MINGIVKRSGRCCYKGKFELLALSERKLKGNGEVPWCGVNGIVQLLKRFKGRYNRFEE